MLTMLTLGRNAPTRDFVIEPLDCVNVSRDMKELLAKELSVLTTAMVEELAGQKNT